MPVIDNRLLDCNGEPELTENLNRILTLVDALCADMASAQADIEETQDALVDLRETTTVTIVFNSNGGSVVETQRVVYGGKASRPDDPQREGYILTGWYLDAAEYNFETAVTRHILLTALWEPDGGPA